MLIEQVRTLVKEEASVFAWILELQGHAASIPAKIAEVNVASRDEALRRGIETAQRILEALTTAGLDYARADAGHGLGHVLRDYVNAIRLVRRADMDPRALFVGFLGGVLHDVGCTICPRFADNKLAIKHGGVAAILLRELFRENDCGLNAAEQFLVEYGVASHTNYLRPITTIGEDGVSRTLKPYADCDSEGNPYLGIFFPRWVDRLDINGPTFIARHYLTLSKPHPEYFRGNFRSIDYASYLRPLLRNDAGIAAGGGNWTMRELMEEFYLSQTHSITPHNRFDIAAMTKLRDALTTMERRILDQVALSPSMSPAREDKVIRAWTAFLSHTMEPHPAVGAPAAQALEAMFRALPDESRRPWSQVFEATMHEYVLYSQILFQDLDLLPAEWLSILGCSDIREVIKPHASWIRGLDLFRDAV